MDKTESVHTESYKYDSVAEMMTHIGAMGSAGWVLKKPSISMLKQTYQRQVKFDGGLYDDLQDRDITVDAGLF